MKFKINEQIVITPSNYLITIVITIVIINEQSLLIRTIEINYNHF